VSWVEDRVSDWIRFSEDRRMVYHAWSVRLEFVHNTTMGSPLGAGLVLRWILRNYFLR